MDTRDFLYFVTVASTRSFSKASEQLYLSQPYLSRRIAKLEKQFGVQLFNRNKHPIQLTDNGWIFYDFAERLLEQEKELCIKIGADITTATGIFSIGSAALTSTYVLPTVVTNIIKNHPNYQITVREGTTTELERQVEKRQIDIAFVVSPNNVVGLQYETINLCRVVMVIPPKNHLYRSENCNSILQAKFNSSDLKGSNFIVSSISPGIGSAAAKYLRLHNISASRITEFDTIEHVLKYCVNNESIAFVPDISAGYSISGLGPNYYDIGSEYKVEISAVFKEPSSIVSDTIEWTKDHWEKISQFPSA